MAPVSEHHQPGRLHSVAAEVEAHVGRAGWDQPPSVFALVRNQSLQATEPELAMRLGLSGAEPDGLTPIEQEPLPEGALDDALAQLAWPETVDGAALSQEIVILPPSVQEQLPDDPGQAAAVAAAHPQRREGRLVVAVLRGGASAAVLRLRANADQEEDDVVSGADLAPNLVAALLATFAD
jgi:hypothetical protein